MKTIGLIGGMSYESSSVYYQLINDMVQKKLGGTHSAKCILYSFDFEEIERLQNAGNWEALTEKMIEVAQYLKNAGADFMVICTNTMHLMAPNIEEKVQVPVLHIADATAEEIVKKGLRKVGLLGTNFTMKGDFYKKRIRDKYGVEVIIPNDEDCQIIHNIIYHELVQGMIRDVSREKFKVIIEKLRNQGAEGVILGCTEIPLLIKQDDFDIPVFDTTEIHALKAALYALS